MSQHNRAALQALLERVEAGETIAAYHASRAFPLGYAHVINAANGDLNAALALHNAVLPGWMWWVSDAPIAVVTSPTRDKAFSHNCSASPARAWLIAIIRALIAEGEA